MKGRMQRNVVLLFICSSAIPLILVSGVGYYSSRHAVTSMIRRQTAFSCVEIEERFARRLRTTEDQFLLVAEGGGSLPQPWETRVRRRGESIEFYTDDLTFPSGLEQMFSGFIFVDSAGQPLHKIGFNESAERRYHVQSAGFTDDDSRGHEASSGLDPGEVRLLQSDPDSGTMLLRFVAPLFSEGRHVATLMGDVDAGALLESIISEMSLGKDAFYFLVDSRSQVLLYHPDYTKRNQLVSVALPSFAEQLAGPGLEGWQRYRDQADQEWLISYRRIAGTPWVCAVAGPLGTFLAPIQRVGLLGMGLVVAVLSLTALSIHLATRRFRSSLASLTDGADAFSSGQLHQRVEIGSDDEMGALARTFNRMAFQLQQQIHERELSARFESFYRLSSAVAHDLKGSLFSLSLLVENMDRHRHDPEFQRDSAQTLRSVVEKMKKTAEKLSRRPSDGEPLMTAVRLEPLLRGVLTDSGVTDHRGMRVETVLDPELEALGDPVELERLFMNLVHNAAEAMPGGGELRVTSSREALNGRIWARTAIQDSGSGMSREFLDNELFRPFASTKPRGIGLGLYTCKSIVDRHLGSIEVDSAPERGTTFVVLLPTEPGGDA